MTITSTNPDSGTAVAPGSTIAIVNTAPYLTQIVLRRDGWVDEIIYLGSAFEPGFTGTRTLSPGGTTEVIEFRKDDGWTESPFQIVASGTSVNSTLNFVVWGASEYPAFMGVGGPLSRKIYLNTLLDVDAPDPNDSEVLAWDDAFGRWVPRSPGTPGAHVLDSHTDVTLTNPVNGQVLTYLNGLWVNGEGGGGGGVSDHGALTGRLDDDHTQYLLVNGARAMTGTLQMGGQSITNMGNLTGGDVVVANVTASSLVNSASGSFTSLVVGGASVATKSGATAAGDIASWVNTGNAIQDSGLTVTQLQTALADLSTILSEGILGGSDWVSDIGTWDNLTDGIDTPTPGGFRANADPGSTASIKIHRIDSSGADQAFFLSRLAAGDVLKFSANAVPDTTNVFEIATIAVGTGAEADVYRVTGMMTQNEFLWDTGIHQVAAHHVGRFNNNGASTDPTVNDDSGDGYSIGSRWINTTLDKEWVCLNASVGAAVWKETTGTGAGSGDVVGPASSVDNTVPLFDGVTGKLLQSAGVNSMTMNPATGDVSIQGTLQMLGNVEAVLGSELRFFSNVHLSAGSDTVDISPTAIFPSGNFDISSAASATAPTFMRIFGGASSGAGVKAGPLFLAGGLTADNGDIEGGDAYLYGGVGNGLGGPGLVGIGGYSVDGFGTGHTPSAKEILIYKGFSILETPTRPVAPANGKGQVWVDLDGKLRFTSPLDALSNPGTDYDLLASGVGSVVGGAGILVDSADPASPIVRVGGSIYNEINTGLTDGDLASFIYGAGDPLVGNPVAADIVNRFYFDTSAKGLWRDTGVTWEQITAAIPGGGTVDTFGTPVALDFARFTDANTIEGRSYAEVRSDLGLVIGTNVAAQSHVNSTDGHPVATLGVAGFMSAADKNNLDGNVTKLTNVSTISAVAGELLNDLTYAAMRSTLELGGAATLNVGTGAGTVAAGDHNHTGVYQSATSRPPLSVTIESPTSGDVILLGRSDRALTIANVHAVLDSGTSVVTSLDSGASRATSDQQHVNAQTVNSTTTGNDLTKTANLAIDTGDWIWVTVGTVTGTVDAMCITVSFS